MATRLDKMLFALADAHPEWIAALPPEQQHMLTLRRNGASLKEIAAMYDLSTAGARCRLYGKGRGLKRAGGVLGHLRWRHTRTKRDEGQVAERSEHDEQLDSACGE